MMDLRNLLAKALLAYAIAAGYALEVVAVALLFYLLA